MKTLSFRVLSIAVICGFLLVEGVCAQESPARPTGIRATDGTFEDRVQITWNMVDGATVYRVFRCIDTGSTCGLPIGFPRQTMFDDLAAETGTTYYYRIKACNPGKCSLFSVANSGFISPTNLDLMARIEELEKLLEGSVRLIDPGTGQDTLRLSGLNLQVVNGTGTTSGETTGTGNLIIGYNETRNNPDSPDFRDGSHMLVIGKGNNYTTNAKGGMVVGLRNEVSGSYSSVSGGASNLASGFLTTISGGVSNTASGANSSVSGGGDNIASGGGTSVTGGQGNEASGIYSTVSGGAFNLVTTDAIYGAISGGMLNTAIGQQSSVSGGQGNTASSGSSSISGGSDNTASGGGASVSGGQNNTANGSFSSISGGGGNITSARRASVSGGLNNEASGENASVSGGKENIANADAASVSGGAWNRASYTNASVNGGVGGQAKSLGASVNGGLDNTASGQYTTVSGGEAKTAAGDRCIVGDDGQDC